MKILVIEDDPAIQQVLVDMLEIHGHTVLRAGTGADGVAEAEKGPEFIFCDIGLPGMSGYDVIEAIKRLPACAEVPFVFLTAYSERGDQRKGMALGADDYITKPFTESDIMDSIRARVNRQRPLKERMEQLIVERRSEISAEWAHELMTPLTAVLCGLDLLESELDSADPAELRSLITLMRAGALRQQWLSRKIIRFFELERLKAGMDPEEISSGQAAEAVTSACERISRAEGRLSDLRVRCDPCEVSLGTAWLDDAVGELVENALRFSPAGSQVCVTGTAGDGMFRVEIADSGPGMTPEQRTRVGAFRQFDRSRREQQGLGIGLAIVRIIMHLGGGRLLLEDGPGGKGLLAILEVPMVRT